MKWQSHPFPSAVPCALCGSKKERRKQTSRENYRVWLMRKQTARTIRTMFAKDMNGTPICMPSEELRRRTLGGRP